MSNDSPRGSIVIYGAGDHGVVVAEAALLSGYDIAGFLDDRAQPGTLVGRWRVLEPDQARDLPLIVAIGDNAARLRKMDECTAAGHGSATVVHPAAWISPSATLGAGVFVGPNAVVHAGATVDDGVIVNSSAVVEHHCHVKEGTHIAPNATLCGRVRIGRLTLIGAGSAVLPVVTIGDDVVVGAGSVVTSDVPDHLTVAGDPARQLR